MNKVNLVGLILWRGGILVAASYVAYLALRAILQITDAQLEFAVAVLLAGVLLVFVSVIMERIEDAKSEQREEQ